MRWINESTFREIEGGGTTAFRVAEGAGATIERFGLSALVSAPDRDGVLRVAEDVPAFAERTGWRCERILGRARVKGPGVDDRPFVVSGRGLEEPREVVMESGLLFEVDFSQSYSPGLFCDQRSNRLVLRRREPGRVLNTFAYTCAFSVAAAAVGARTTSVDVSKASLQRGRRNFELNGLAMDGHRFVAEDTLTYMERLVRRGEVFDAVILDPPTFGRGGGSKVFRLERDFELLVGVAAALLAPGGAVLLSCNFSEWTAADLRRVGAEFLPDGTRFEEAESQPDCHGHGASATVWAFLP